MKYSVVIVAAGSSTRFKSETPKMLFKIGDELVIDKTRKLFINDDDCSQIIIVVNEAVKEYLKDKLVAKEIIVDGGNQRYLSVNNGLKEVKEDYVFIHDGARCFLSKQDLENLKENVSDACLLVGKVVDTIKVVDDGYIKQTINRDTLAAAQTPQVFKTRLLKECYKQAIKDSYSATDEAGIVEKYSNVKIKVIYAYNDNKKVTTIDDIRG